jgi:hypothetical protein
LLADELSRASFSRGPLMVSGGKDDLEVVVVGAGAAGILSWL